MDCHAGQPARHCAGLFQISGGAGRLARPAGFIARRFARPARLGDARLGASPQSRTRLFASLQQRGAAPGHDLDLGARSSRALCAGLGGGDWAQAGDSAILAIRFLDELRSGLAPARFELRRGLAVSAFMRGASAEAYTAVYDVAAELADLIATTPDGAIRQRYAAEYFAALAWGDVMYDALGSRQKNTPDRRTTVRQVAYLLYPAPDGDPALPRCRVVLARNFENPGFPFESRFKNLGGEVIYALNVEAGGLFSILACWSLRPTPASRRRSRTSSPPGAGVSRKCVAAQLPHAAGPHPHLRFCPG